LEDEECPGDLVCDIEAGACVLLIEEDVWVEEEDAMMQPDGETDDTSENTEELLDEDSDIGSEWAEDGESDAETDESTPDSSLSPSPDEDAETTEETTQRTMELPEEISPDTAGNEAERLPHSETNERDRSGGEGTDTELSRTPENSGCQSSGNGSGALAVMGFILFLVRRRKPILVS